MSSAVSQGSREIWQVAPDGETFSPACSERDLDSVVDTLEALDRGVPLRRYSNLSQARARRTASAATAAAATPPHATPQHTHPAQSYGDQQRSVDRLHSNKGKLRRVPPQTPTRPGGPAPAATPGTGGTALSGERLAASVKRLHDDGVARRAARLKASAEKRMAREVVGLRTEYPLIPEEELAAKAAGWAEKGGGELAKLTREEVARRTTAAMRMLGKRTTRTSADTVLRDRQHAKLHGDAIADNPCIDADTPWVSCTFARSIAKQRDAVDRQLVAAQQQPPPKTLPEEELPHDRWAAQGGKALARLMVEEKLAQEEYLEAVHPRCGGPSNPDSVKRSEVLANLVSLEHASAADRPFAPVHPMKGMDPWLPHCGRARSARRDRESDLAVLPERQPRLRRSRSAYG